MTAQETDFIRPAGPPLTDNTTAALWMQHHRRMDEMQQHFRTEMTACIDQTVRLERQLSDTQTRLDSLQDIVIGSSEDDSFKHSILHRLGVLDGHERKDYQPPTHPNALTGHHHVATARVPAFVDPTFPIPELPHEHSDIHTEEQKVDSSPQASYTSLGLGK